MNNQEALEQQATIFKALGHPVRLLFVNQLTNGPKCVCELRTLTPLDFSTVSRHLSVLKNAGIIKDEKQGLRVYYHLAMPCVAGFMGCVQKATGGKDV